MSYETRKRRAQTPFMSYYKIGNANSTDYRDLPYNPNAPYGVNYNYGFRDDLKSFGRSLGIGRGTQEREAKAHNLDKHIRSLSEGARKMFYDDFMPRWRRAGGKSNNMKTNNRLKEQSLKNLGRKYKALKVMHKQTIEKGRRKQPTESGKKTKQQPMGAPRLSTRGGGESLKISGGANY